MGWYNENDPRAAAWLKELVKEELIPSGEVDERSIADINPGDIPDTGHFFAGIGGWPYALQLAGWPTDWDVWTGSCPCQPLSSAGKRRGADDERHLWPVWYDLIKECRPPVIFGEQVASKLGREWLSGVRADLEDLGYAFGAADLCAAGEGAPHIRQRLYWVAHAGQSLHGSQSGLHVPEENSPGYSGRTGGRGESSWLADDQGIGLGQGDQDARGSVEGSPAEAQRPRPANGGFAGRLDDTAGDGAGHGDAAQPGSDGPDDGLPGQAGTGRSTDRMADSESSTPGPGDDLPRRESDISDGREPIGNSWSRFDLVACGDGKSRRVESGTFPLAHGIPRGVGRYLPRVPGFDPDIKLAVRNRLSRLKGYGNAINPQTAATFIRAYIAWRLEMMAAR